MNATQSSSVTKNQADKARTPLEVFSAMESLCDDAHRHANFQSERNHYQDLIDEIRALRLEYVNLARANNLPAGRVASGQ